MPHVLHYLKVKKQLQTGEKKKLHQQIGFQKNDQFFEWKWVTFSKMIGQSKAQTSRTFSQKTELPLMICLIKNQREFWPPKKFLTKQKEAVLAKKK